MTTLPSLVRKDILYDVDGTIPIIMMRELRWEMRDERWEIDHLSSLIYLVLNPDFRWTQIIQQWSSKAVKPINPEEERYNSTISNIRRVSAVGLIYQLSATVLQMTTLALLFAAAYMGSVRGFGGSPMRFTTRCTKHSATPSDSSTGEESSVFFVIFFRPFAFERIDLRCRLWNDVKWPKLTHPTVADKLIASAYLVLFCCFSSSALTYLFLLNTLLIHK